VSALGRIPDPSATSRRPEVANSHAQRALLVRFAEAALTRLESSCFIATQSPSSLTRRFRIDPTPTIHLPCP
jgi:hypothetical protein